MRGIILLGHGSRVPGAGDGMEKVADLLKTKYKLDIVETCYMSRLGPYFSEILAKCVSKGVNEVILMPYFLNAGLHIRLDVPEMMKEEIKKYPDIKLIYGENLGFDELLADIVYKRICSSSDSPDIREVKLEPRENFPVPPGQGEFVEVMPKNGEAVSGHHHSHSGKKLLIF